MVQERSGRLLVLVVGDSRHSEEFGRFVRRYDAEIATDRHVDVEKVYVAASWFTGLAKSRGRMSQNNLQPLLWNAVTESAAHLSRVIPARSSRWLRAGV